MGKKGVREGGGCWRRFTSVFYPLLSIFCVLTMMSIFSSSDENERRILPTLVVRPTETSDDPSNVLVFATNTQVVTVVPTTKNLTDDNNTNEGRMDIELVQDNIRELGFEIIEANAFDESGQLVIAYRIQNQNSQWVIREMGEIVCAVKQAGTGDYGLRIGGKNQNDITIITATFEPMTLARLDCSSLDTINWEGMADAFSFGNGSTTRTGWGTPEATAIPSGDLYYSQLGSVNVRACPQLTCDVVTRLGRGDAIEIVNNRVDGDAVNRDTRWMRGVINGEIVYVHWSLVARTMPAAIAPAAVAPVNSYTNNRGSSSNAVPQQQNVRPANCAEAVAMGLTAQQAAQWSHLDRDGDDVACYGD